MTIDANNLSLYLQADYFADYDNPAIIEFSQKVIDNSSSKTEIAIKLYYYIRDHFRYNPFCLYTTKEKYRASHFLTRQEGHCIDKANLLIACCRLHGIPARYRFADVRNHIGTEKLQAILETDLLVYHGMAELFLEGKWVKATPVFNIELCEKLNVAPLDFDGKEDSIFQQYDKDNNTFIEYVYDRGSFSELPFKDFLEVFFKHYPQLHDSEYIFS